VVESDDDEEYEDVIVAMDESEAEDVIVAVDESYVEPFNVSFLNVLDDVSHITSVTCVIAGQRMLRRNHVAINAG
jgi:hypothetical protein